MQGRGGGSKPEIVTGGPPEQRALPAHGMQEREWGGGEQYTGEGTPPKQRALPEHGMQEWGGEGGASSSPKERG